MVLLNMNKKSKLLTSVAFVLCVASLSAEAASEPRKNYPGDPLPDNQIALIVPGWGDGSAEHGIGEIKGFRANVAGIDGVDCPENPGRGGGDPYCGLFVQMAPGEHTLKVRVVSDVKNVILAQSWRERYVDGVRAVLEKDTIYRLVPVRQENGAFSVSVEEVCRGKAHNELKVYWVLHDKEMPQGFVCPK